MTMCLPLVEGNLDRIGLLMGDSSTGSFSYDDSLCNPRAPSRVRVSIIPVSRTLSSIELFGLQAPALWSLSNVLENAAFFYM